MLARCPANLLASHRPLPLRQHTATTGTTIPSETMPTSSCRRTRTWQRQPPRSPPWHLPVGAFVPVCAVRQAAGLSAGLSATAAQQSTQGSLGGTGGALRLLLPLCLPHKKDGHSLSTTWRFYNRCSVLTQRTALAHSSLTAAVAAGQPARPGQAAQLRYPCAPAHVNPGTAGLRVAAPAQLTSTDAAAHQAGQATHFDFMRCTHFALFMLRYLLCTCSSLCCDVTPTYLTWRNAHATRAAPLNAAQNPAQVPS